MYLASAIFLLGLSQLLDLCKMGMVIANALSVGYAFKEFLYFICSHSIFILSFPSKWLLVIHYILMTLLPTFHFIFTVVFE